MGPEPRRLVQTCIYLRRPGSCECRRRKKCRREDSEGRCHARNASRSDAGAASEMGAGTFYIVTLSFGKKPSFFLFVVNSSLLDD
jgi:hypothetical protein